MLATIINKYKASKLKGRINYYSKEIGLSIYDKEQLLKKLMVYFSNEQQNYTALYVNQMVRVYEGDVMKETISVRSGSLESAICLTDQKVIYIDKQEYLTNNRVVQVGPKASTSSSSSGDSGGLSNNNNNNNNNNNG